MPPLAASNTPWRATTAPVKAPRSWPKSSLSSSVGRHRAAVDDHERLVPARAAAVDRLGARPPCRCRSRPRAGWSRRWATALPSTSNTVCIAVERPDHPAEAIVLRARPPGIARFQADGAAADAERGARTLGTRFAMARTSTIGELSLTEIDPRILRISDAARVAPRRSGAAPVQALSRAAAILAAPSRPGCACVTT